jgi:hypothetical protein
MDDGVETPLVLFLNIDGWPFQPTCIHRIKGIIIFFLFIAKVIGRVLPELGCPDTKIGV